MPNPVDGLKSLLPCASCGGEPVVNFDLIGLQAVGTITCMACGRHTKRRPWIEAKREWNGGGLKRTLDDTTIE